MVPFFVKLGSFLDTMENNRKSFRFHFAPLCVSVRMTPGFISKMGR
jgi:hypothetical protein